ncbi:Rv2231c family pyridoxal phosphate-dependent protein CobC [Allorhizocola rhizosphaerae]|uniref:Rv2231c family pyridoxal phosphate-dependent protein CobC n=1 Tax=Allorhizocola rhizosphaerae TaxID=1872709 RepID=UPI000E3CA884|nr:Rv2231c family pyridoxal phosphate-dependent protein CobC [Allorhizocola rhizosphaerae]
MDDALLAHHGDSEVGPGLIDLAVNVRTDPLPDWLAEPIRSSLDDLARYPDGAQARAAVAARHGRPVEEVLLTAGAAQAFTLVAQALRPGRAVVVHPQFTEPEAALRQAGQAVERAVLPPPFVLDHALIPAEADLVVIGNPTNPTSVLHPASVIERLARPGRVVLVDEAFADTIPGEAESVAHRRDLPGLVVVRSLTKTWGLAGLRVGYVLGPAPIIARLESAAPLWPVSTPALAAAIACSSPVAVVEAHRIALALADDRAHLVGLLAQLPGVAVAGTPTSSFVLVHLAGADRVRLALRSRGWAVRRGDTFPGLGPDWLRIAVRDHATMSAFASELAYILGRHERAPHP